MNEDLTRQKYLKILVVDDIEVMLKSTVQFLKEKYPEAEIETATTTEETVIRLNTFNPNLLILDLQISEKNGGKTEMETGVNLLEKLLDDKNLKLNIVILSQHLKTLVRLKDKIDDYHGGGFVTNDKNSIEQFLKKVDLALYGITHTKDIPGFREKNLNLKPDWLEVLKLAWYEELTDHEIAKRIHRTLRGTRNYWSKIQDVLGVYPEDNINLRIRTIKRAIEKGFLDL